MDLLDENEPWKALLKKNIGWYLDTRSVTIRD